ncbi:MAG: flagellar biosynthesis protein FlhB [bacterium]
MADPGKTENATAKKKEEARKKGQVARSVEINVVLNVLASFLVLKIAGEYIMHNLKELSIYFWGNILTFSIDPNSMSSFITFVVIRLLLILLPLLAVAFVVAILSNVLQFGFLFTFESMKPTFDRVNPASGFKRIFVTKRILFELVKTLFKVVVISYILYSTSKKILNEIFLTPLMDINTYFLFAADSVYKLGMKVVLAFIVFSIIDYLYQRFEFEDSLKMSKQEVKDELKQMEGDPLIKSRIRQLQREMARKRMISEIPYADVVITNPTHIAVALRYKEGEDEAPKIVGKGINLMAEKVKQIAREHGVIIIENPPLARTLVKLEIGWTVPPDLFQAVAEILAFVYQAKGKIRLEENNKKVDNTILNDTYIPRPNIGGI